MEILEIEVCNILHNLEIRAAGGRRRAGGSRGNIGNIGNMSFSIFLDFSKKDARRNFTQDAPVHGPRSLI